MTSHPIFGGDREKYATFAPSVRNGTLILVLGAATKTPDRSESRTDRLGAQRTVATTSVMLVGALGMATDTDPISLLPLVHHYVEVGANPSGINPFGFKHSGCVTIITRGCFRTDR